MPDRRSLCAVAALAALFLFYFASVHLPLDQDLGSKAAKIESLARLAPFASPVQPPLYYRESYFPFYYQVEALVHKILPGTAIASTGYSAALCGVIYLLGLSVYLYRLAGISPWWSFFLFLNTPALVVTFLYGNEASLSMALLVAAVALLALERGVKADAVAGVVLGLAFWCRPDIVLMGPFVILLLEVNWRRVGTVGLAGIVTSVVYWLAFVREIPSEAAFPWIIDWRIFAVYLVFGFGPVVFSAALLGLFKGDRRQWLLPLASAVPILYYFRDLGSPKYILGLALGTTLAAAWLIASVGRAFKIVIVVASLVFWLLAISPFGIFGPARGGRWVAPAGHGPVPFGSYLAFYENVRNGFFGYRYGALERTWEVVLKSLQIDPRPMVMLGSSDDHMLNLICEERGGERRSAPITIDQPGDSIGQAKRFAMLFNGYTRLSYLTHRGAEATVREWLRAGQVAPLAGDETSDGLPLAVEIGATVVKRDAQLGERILAADARARSSGLAPLQTFTSDYGAFCFSRRTEATTDCGNHETIWGNWWPSVYYRQHGDKARAALTGGAK